MEKYTVTGTIGLCSDHAGYPLKETLKKYLTDRGYSVRDFGTDSTASCDYPDFAHPCAEAVENGQCQTAIAMCGSGNGIGMTLNKHRGIRAAICWTPELGMLARAHNDANILVLPARMIPAETAEEIVQVFLTTPFDGGRHQARIDKIPT